MTRTRTSTAVLPRDPPIARVSTHRAPANPRVPYPSVQQRTTRLSHHALPPRPHSTTRAHRHATPTAKAIPTPAERRCVLTGATTTAPAGGRFAFVLGLTAKHGTDGEDGEMSFGGYGPANVLLAGSFDIRSFRRLPSRLYVPISSLLSGTSTDASLALFHSFPPSCCYVSTSDGCERFVSSGRTADETMVALFSSPGGSLTPGPDHKSIPLSYPPRNMRS